MRLVEYIDCISRVELVLKNADIIVSFVLLASEHKFPSGEMVSLAQL